MKEEASMFRFPKISGCVQVLTVAALGLLPAPVVFALDADNTTKTDNFDVDPQWDSFQNHTTGNNFGFSNTNTLGAPSTAGEIGGNLARDVRGWYADDIGEVDPSTDTLTMSGRMWLHIEGDNDTEAHIGWFDKDGLGGANTPSQFLGFRMIKDPPYEVRVLWQPASNNLGQTDIAQFDVNIFDSVPFDFSFTYNPTAFFNQGQITTTIDGQPGPTVNLPVGVKDAFSNFDRFGLIGGATLGQNRFTQMYIDNLTYTLTKASAAALGDFNQDGNVNDADFAIMKTNWLTSGRVKNTLGEVTGDSVVDLKDFKLFKESLYAPGAGAVALSIPEPAALTLLAIVAPFLLSWRKRSEGRLPATNS